MCQSADHTTLAHRLRTVIEFDRIIVMHEGSVAEYDTPANLLADPTSRFYALCQAVSESQLRYLLLCMADQLRFTQTGPEEFCSLQQISAAKDRESE